VSVQPIEGTTDRRIDALLRLLADNPMIVISGAKVAREIGVSRFTVRHWVDKLRALGVKVKGQRGAGYRIEKVPDVLVPSLLRRRLAGTQFDKRVHHFFKIGSTNELLMRLGQLGEPHGAVAIAEEQTAGRGRAGRSWHSEKSSGIYASVLLRPAIPPTEAPVLTLLAGLAACDAVAEQTGLEPDIRWPNDLLLNGKKFCGILNELEAEPDRIHFLVVGFGLNVNHAHLPEGLAGRATSLRIETGRTQSRLELLVRLLRQLDRYYNRFLAEGAKPIIERFSEVSSFARGKRVRVSLANQSFVGTTAGLEPSGLLRVRREDGRTEIVLAGDLAEAD
jgi:BirA family transcriptional regulator, biotin operon repressor / biotin---[acetyl-CoA-carboxylase] ligase